jgi:transposase
MRIFTLAYKYFIEQYLVFKKRISGLFIDSTVIQNINCAEKLGTNMKFKGKKSVKVTSLVTDDTITVAFSVDKSNIHDSKITVPVIDKLPNLIKLTYHNPVYVVGDKGYISKGTKKILKKRNLILVYPNRKNAKEKTVQRYKKKLKKRFNVESSYSHLKRTYHRTRLVIDSKISNFTTFIEMAYTCEIIKFLSDKTNTQIQSNIFKSAISNIINHVSR